MAPCAKIPLNAKRSPRYVIKWLLQGQVRAGCLGVKLESPGHRILGPQPVSCDARPDSASGAELGYLFEKTDRNVEKERESWQEFIRIHATSDRIFGKLNRTGQCVAHRFCGRGSSLLHVLANNGYRIPFRHMLDTESDVIIQYASCACQGQTKKHMIGNTV